MSLGNSGVFNEPVNSFQTVAVTTIRDGHFGIIDDAIKDK